MHLCHSHTLLCSMTRLFPTIGSLNRPQDEINGTIKLNSDLAQIIESKFKSQNI
jgi:hypothetical protein